jgi:pyruvate formate lyase activating enzyme
MEEAILFDIKHCQLTDIQPELVLVFKGCPLECVWCHTATARSFKPELRFNPDLCQRCFTCVTSCHHQVHEIDDANHLIRFDHCQNEGNCVRSCPFSALKISGKKYSSLHLLKVVEPDLEILKINNGQVVLTGGEPMVQINFLMPLVKKFKELGLKIVIDTSGYVKTSNFKKILPYIDQFLFDYKETDPFRHYEFTGVYNQLILVNLEFLLSQHADVLLTCPIVPGYNDNRQHFQGIIDLSKKYPGLKIMLMPYQKVSEQELINAGISRTTVTIEPPELAKIKRWKQKLSASGCNLVD